MGIETGIILAAASLATTAYSAYEQNRAAGRQADAQKEAKDISSAQQEVQRRRQRRQQVREERIRRARIIQSSENSGVSGSSGAIGSLGALATNTDVNMASGSQQTAAANGITDASQAAADARSDQQLWQGVGQISGTVFSGAGGFGAFDSTTAPKRSESAGLYNYQYFD